MRRPLLTFIATFALLMVQEARANDWQKGIVVSMDYATTMRLPTGVTTLVIGNPIIADATVQTGGVMVVTGKSYGTTNLIALDRGGNKIAETMVRVQALGQNVVRVFRGNERETYTCVPNCERSVTVGDTDPFFSSTIQQGNNRIQQGTAASPSATPPGIGGYYPPPGYYPPQAQAPGASAPPQQQQQPARQ